MKHQLLALLLGSLLLLGLPAACADTPTMTVLMYMCGTDLQSDCVNDLYEMCAADIPDNVTVVVQAGGASQCASQRPLPLFSAIRASNSAAGRPERDA